MWESERIVNNPATKSKTLQTGKKVESALSTVLQKIQNLKIGVLKISTEFPAQITARGSSFYLRLPKDIVDYYELQSGDWLKVKATEVKRIVSTSE